MDSALVEADGLVKVYPGGVEAVRGVSFEAGKGITVLMGPNGSGKTTTLSMVAGALKPTRGRVRVCGLDMWGGDWSRPRMCVGFAPQDMPLLAKLTGMENLVWYGLIRGLSLGEARRRARRLLEEVGLSDAASRRIATYSGGMKRRLMIAAALMGDPSVLVLDEPTSGLDPGARLQLWRLLEGLARDRAVIASTHIPEEAEKHADMVLVFHRGRIVARGPPERLIEEYAPQSTIIVEGALPGEPPRIDGVEASTWSKERARLVAQDPDTVLPGLVEALLRAGARISRIEVSKPGLAEVYLSVTGEVLG